MAAGVAGVSGIAGLVAGVGGSIAKSSKVSLFMCCIGSLGFVSFIIVLNSTCLCLSVDFQLSAAGKRLSELWKTVEGPIKNATIAWAEVSMDIDEALEMFGLDNDTKNKNAQRAFMVLMYFMSMSDKMKIIDKSFHDGMKDILGRWLDGTNFENVGANYRKLAERTMVKSVLAHWTVPKAINNIANAVRMIRVGDIATGGEAAATVAAGAGGGEAGARASARVSARASIRASIRAGARAGARVTGRILARAAGPFGAVLAIGFTVEHWVSTSPTQKEVRKLIEELTSMVHMLNVREELIVNTASQERIEKWTM